MFSPYQFWFDLASLFLNPKATVLGMVELGVTWAHSRDWRKLAYALPLLLIGGYMFGSSQFVFWIGKSHLVANYWKVIETQSKRASALMHSDSNSEKGSEADSNANESEEKISQVINQLLLKTLELEVSNSKASYLIACSFAESGKASQARHIMRAIAPENESGFPAAHAWLAIDRLQTLGVKNAREKQLLLHDLSKARQWPGVRPVLMGAYAEALLAEKRLDEALDVLREAGKRDSRLKIRLVQLAKQNNLPFFDSMKNEILQDLGPRVESGTASEAEHCELMALFMLEDRLEPSIELAQRGLKLFPESTQIRRLLSNTYMQAFEKAGKEPAKSDSRIGLLDQAMRADPGNPLVMEQVASLSAQGKLTNENILAYLREQLASGKATAITHLLVAVGHLRQNQLDKATIHLEIAHGLSPDNPIILNNLAICVARTKPDELPRARRMIEIALTVGGRNAEMLDSYGEILELMKDYTGAIRAYEAALSIRPDRSTTRQRLANAYLQVSMPEMAEAVLKKGAKTTDATADQAKDSAKTDAKDSSAVEQKPMKVLPNGVIQKDGLLPTDNGNK